MALSTAPGACKHFHMLFSCSVVSDSLGPHRPARFLCPWNSPGKNPGVGCHFLSRGSSWRRDRTRAFCISRWVLSHLSHRGSPQNLGQLERWGKHTRNRRFFVCWRKRECLRNLILQYKIMEALFLPPRFPLTKDSIFFSRAGEGNRVSRLRWAGFSGPELDLLFRAPTFCHPILLSPPLRISTSDKYISVRLQTVYRPWVKAVGWQKGGDRIVQAPRYLLRRELNRQRVVLSTEWVEVLSTEWMEVLSTEWMEVLSTEWMEVLSTEWVEVLSTE